MKLWLSSGKILNKSNKNLTFQAVVKTKEYLKRKVREHRLFCELIKAIQRQWIEQQGVYTSNYWSIQHSNFRMILEVKGMNENLNFLGLNPKSTSLL